MGHGIHTRGTAAILSRQKSLTEMTSELQVFQRANALFLQGPLVVGLPLFVFQCNSILMLLVTAYERIESHLCPIV